MDKNRNKNKGKAPNQAAKGGQKGKGKSIKDDDLSLLDELIMQNKQELNQTPNEKATEKQQSEKQNDTAKTTESFAPSKDNNAISAFLSARGILGQEEQDEQQQHQESEKLPETKEVDVKEESSVQNKKGKKGATKGQTKKQETVKETVSEVEKVEQKVIKVNEKSEDQSDDKPTSETKKKDQKEKGKKSAAARLIEERKQRELKEQEQFRLMEEARLEKIREVERKKEEELKKLEEIKEKKKKKKKRKIEKQKEEGTYKTQGQKKKEAELAIGRARLLVGVNTTQVPASSEMDEHAHTSKGKGHHRETGQFDANQTGISGEQQFHADEYVENDDASDSDSEEEENEKKQDKIEAFYDDWDAVDEDDFDIPPKTDNKPKETSKVPPVQQNTNSTKLHEQNNHTNKLQQENNNKQQEKKVEQVTQKSIEKAIPTKFEEVGKKELNNLQEEKNESKEKHEFDSHLRSPVCCVMGHVDAGKTKLLDNIRRTNVQEGEAGGITQQIGATFFPKAALSRRAEELNRTMNLDIQLPGLLVIDTPGHESFTNLRSRGSSLCDIAIIVVDLTHGLEPQTIESIKLLRKNRTPFVVALNKVDRCYGWKSTLNAPFQASFATQNPETQDEFHHRAEQVRGQLMEQSLNAELYWKNKKLGQVVSMIPTSAATGEGIQDLLLMLIKLTQERMAESLRYRDMIQCTVLEVKVIEGLGTTIDVILVNGTLKEGDRIVICTFDGPIVTTIRALLTPPPSREIRVKSEYIHHQSIRAAMGIKICAHDLEGVLPGTSVLVVDANDNEEDVKSAAMEDLSNVMSAIKLESNGVYVQASTLGALEALLQFLQHDCNPVIPVASVGIGPIFKKSIIKASIMHDKGFPEYATILAFDVRIDHEARLKADELGVRIFSADVIYHLFNQFQKYIEEVNQKKREEAMAVANFPCIIKIIPEFIIKTRDPIIVGAEVVDGVLRVGTRLCIPGRNMLQLGTVTSMESNHKNVDRARKGESVSIKITAPANSNLTYGRQFDATLPIYSVMSRPIIEALKKYFREDLSKEDWLLVKNMKTTFHIP